MQASGVDSRRALAALAGVAVAALGAGCGGSGGSTTAGGASTPKAAAPVAAAPAQRAVKSVDLVRMAIARNIRSADPVEISDQDDADFAALTGGRLFEYEPGSLTDTVPVLADKGTTAPDKMSFRVRLRRGLRFSDGSPLRAADVKVSLERGTRTKSSMAVAFANIKSVRVDDPRTVTISFKQPEGDFSRALTAPATAIVPKRAATDKSFFTHPVVSGPYAVRGNWQGDHFALVRNPHYGGPAPAIERFDVQVVPDPTAAVTRLRGGQLDFVGEIPANTAGSLSGEVTARTVQTKTGMFLTYTNKDPLFSDERIRKAIGFAIDRPQLSQVAFAGKAKPVLGPFTPVQPYRGDVFPATPDLARARTLLRGTRCQDGCSFTLSTFASQASTAGQMAAAIQQMLTPLHIKVTLQPLEDQTFIKRSLAGQLQAVITKDASYATPSPFQLDLNPEAGGCLFGGCSSTKIQPALAKLEAASTPRQVKAGVAAIRDVYADWVPWVPLTTLPVTYGLRRDLVGVIGVAPNTLLAVAPQSAS